MALLAAVLDIDDAIEVVPQAVSDNRLERVFSAANTCSNILSY
jgi:hypothetical protein